MALYVNTNVSSLTSQRHLNNVQNQLNVSYQRLASGMRINSSKDDAAGFQISDRLTSQINGLNQGNRNANDDLALLQTIDGGAEEIVNQLQRVRTLLVQASNGTNTKEDLLAIQEEVRAALLGASAIATDTKFAGKQILTGHMRSDDDIFEPVRNGKNHIPGTLTFQVGANKGDAIIAKIQNFFVPQILIEKKFDNGGKKQNLEDMSDGAFTIGKSQDGTAETLTVDISTHQLARNALGTMDFLIGEIDSRRGEVGAYMNRLESSIRNQSNVSENQADARSRIRDTDFASETANLTQKNIIQQAASSILLQSNSRPQIALSLLGS